jgi:hypothetical protein
MRKLAAFLCVTAILSALPVLPAAAQQGWNHGCYRFGETGYHWYNVCLGPDFAYPHHRVCDHNGFCSYT